MMHTYKWIALDTLGKKTYGTLHAENKTEADHALKSEGRTIVSLKKIIQIRFQRQYHLGKKIKMDLIRQLFFLLQAGVPIVDALALIIYSTKNIQLKNILSIIKEKIISGKSFSQALRYFPTIFDPFLFQFIAIGERSGKLTEILEKIMIYSENALAFQNRFLKTILYPGIVLIISILISIGLTVFIIPEFQSLYQNFGASLPWLTKMLIYASQKIRQDGLFIFLFFVFSFLMIKQFLWKKKNVHQFFSRVILKIPLITHIVISREITRWSSALFILLSAGIALSDAMPIANQTVRNVLLQQQLNTALNHVMLGLTMHDALKHCRDFPERARYFIMVGENTDALLAVLQKLTTLYQNETDDLLDRLSKLLEPVIMIGVAGLVSGMIIAMYLPIFRLGNVI